VEPHTACLTIIIMHSFGSFGNIIDIILKFDRLLTCLLLARVHRSVSFLTRVTRWINRS